MGILQGIFRVLGISMFFTGFIGFAILIGSAVASNFTLVSYFNYAYRLASCNPKYPLRGAP